LTLEEAPSTLAGCPPVSTFELTWTSVCRSGATVIVTETTKATAASTAAGRNRESVRAESQSGRGQTQ
jgi:hypothetical protein